MSDWRQGLIPCKPWNSVRPERNECRRCSRDVYGASVQRILFPLEVEKLYGDTYGIETERYFDDMVVESEN